MCKHFKKIICLLLSFSAVCFSGCAGINTSNNAQHSIDSEPVTQQSENSSQTHELNELSGKDSKKPSGIAIDDKFKKAQMSFGWNLFKNAFDNDKSKNALISPFSVSAALSMTTNGAKGKTLEELENIVCGDLDINTMNEYFYTYINDISGNKENIVSVANSIWVKDSLSVSQDFLNTNKSFYDSQVFSEKFDDSTKDKINYWVNQKTNSMIDKIVDRIDPQARMYLINALAFDGKWQDPYDKKTDTYKEEFTNYDNSKNEVDIMHGEEYGYLSSNNAVGFIKPYKNNEYSFVAILPNEDIDFDKYVKDTTPDDIFKMIENKKESKVLTKLPKFEYDYDINLNNILMSLGMKEGFDRSSADFSKMLDPESADLYIGNVLHKTHISVDTEGTKAAAVTSVEMMAKGALEMEQPYEVFLTRPFLYMIIDNKNNIPLFIGAVTNLG